LLYNFTAPRFGAELPNHQGKGNILLFSSPSPEGEADGPMQCRERLGGLLKYYEREAA
jgi:hypothetical protein